MFDIQSYLAEGAQAALRSFAEEHCEALLNAAELLGATEGLSVAQSVLDGLAQSHPPSVRTLAACVDLLDLLTLRHVHDPSRIEAAQFATIDPAWPIVEEICLLADGYRDVLEGYLDEVVKPSVQVAA